ncbi:MAG: hypothetical protein ACI8QZ_002366 [Chlamydiales bacterium]|jgi:hypothetical protein
MQVKTLGVLAVLLALAALVTALLSIDGSGPAAGTEVKAATPPGQVQASAPARVDDVGLAPIERAPARPSNVVLDTENLGGPTRATVPAASQPEERASHADVRIDGRCVDVNGSPLAGVELRCAVPEASVSSAADGRFELPLRVASARLEEPLALIATLIGYVRLELEPISNAAAAEGRVELGDVVLRASGGVSGQVVDESGKGVPEARVVVTAMGPLGWSARGSGPETPLIEGLTESEGRFRLGGIGAGEVRIWGGVEGAWWAYSDSVQVESGRETAEILLRLEELEPEDVIELRVLDPDMQPVAGAELSYFFHQDGSSASGSAETDEDGVYRRVLERRAAFDFVARDPEETFRPAVARGVVPGTVDLELILGAPRALAVRVRGTGGKDVPAFMVSSRSGSGQRWLRGPSQRSADAGGDTVVFQLPVEGFELTAEADGFQSTKLGPLDPDEVGATIEIAMEPLPGVRGQVFDGAGKPVVGANVGLHPAVAGDSRLTVNGFPARSQKHSSSRGVTDDEGRFTLTLQESGSFYLRAQAGAGAGSAVGEVGPIDLDGSVGANGLRVDLLETGAIDGKLLLAPGRDVAGLVIGISRGDGFAVTGRTDARGNFRFAGLTPGDWYVKRCAEEIREGWTNSSSSDNDGERELPWSCEVWPGRTTRFDLDLTEAAHVVLVGRLTLGGAPRPGWKAEVRRTEESGGEDSVLAEDLLDSQGDFRLELTAEGDYALTFTGPGDSGHVFMSQEVHLGPGTSDWTRDLPMGAIEGHVSLQLLSSGETLSSSWTEDGGLTYLTFVAPEADGSFRFQAPAGAVRLNYAESEPKRVHVGDGALTRVDLP